MLAAKADIVFLVDKSASSGTEFSWIADVVSRANGLDAYLRNASRDIDPRYGLVGFGDDSFDLSTGAPWGHSHLLDVNDGNGDGDKLFGTASQLANVVQTAVNAGSYELAWDGIEHAIQEYEFRPGAAVIFVLFRRDDLGGSFPVYYVGNEPNDSNLEEQTRTGILAALDSYNVTLNTVIEAMFDPAMYSSANGGIVLGVEADRADNVLDGRQIAHVVNPVANQPTPSDALLVSRNGTNSGVYVDSGKSVRISAAAAATIAGPSAGGYRAESIAYAFEDITGTGTAITSWDQYYDYYKELTPTNLGTFSFNFYDESYDSLVVNADGSITFDGPSEEFESSVDWTVDSPLSPRIAPLWDQFDTFSEPFDVYWQVKNSGQANERLVVQWSGMNYAGDFGFGSSETVTFQAVLYANGDIVFNYQDLDVSDPLFSDGENSTVGIGTNEFLYPDVVPAGVFIDRVHAIDKTEFYGADDDFVRLAWETGGASWNNDVISGSSGGTPSYVTAFDAAFIESIAKQIADKHRRGDVAFADSPILQVNMGGLASGPYIADTHSSLGPNFLPAGTTTLSSSQAVLRNGNSMAGDANTLNVFKTAREMQNGDLDLNVPATLVPDGRYVVELMFASFSGSSDYMQVYFENGASPVLDHYITRNDRAKIPSTSTGSPEYEAVPLDLGDGVPIVKRYSVDVTGGNGLQIKLKSLGSNNTLISGLRVLKTPPPRIDNVVISGSTWADGVEYAFDDLVNAGQQLRPIPTQNANTIEIHFDGPVKLSQNALTVAKTIRNTSSPTATPTNSVFVASNANGVGFVYDSVNYIARWTFPASGNYSLVDGKYAIYLNASAVTGGGQPLDGDWTNKFGTNDLLNPTADLRGDDPARAFITGGGAAGTAGTNFRLNFALLAGDYNGDGIVTTAAVSGGPAVDVIVAGDRWSDGNGDGVTTANNTDDLNVRAGNGGDYLPLRRLTDPADNNGFYGADLKDDDYVDGGDLAVWKATFGTGGNGDINGDNATDGVDFLIWQTQLGSYSAWSPYLYPGAPTAAAMASIVSAPPRVTNVTISGSASLHAPFSYNGPNDATDFDGSGLQLKTAPVGGADTISITFDQTVNIGAEHLLVVGLQTFNLPDLAEFSYDAATFTATWRFEGWSLGDQYLLALSDLVTSVDGNWLDGEWTNPASTTTVNSLVSEFPSGDGNAGGMFKFVVTLLPGDANLDNAVNIADFSIFSTNYPTASGALFTQGDFNGTGSISFSDFSILSANYNRDLHLLSMKADFDGDFDVDASDLSVIGTNAGMTSGATWANGDLDGDGDVDMSDLDLAFAQFGQALSVVA